jgi:hypothetical protein
VGGDRCGACLRRFALLGGDRVARLLQLQPDRRHPLDRGLRFVAQPLDPVGDRVVVALDAAEVFGAGVDLRPALRVDDDAEHVGAARLVHVDQPFAQRLERPAQARPDDRQVALLGFQLGGGGIQLALLAGQFAFERQLFLAQPRDFAQHRVDRPVLLGDRRAQRALAFAHLAQLALRRVELFAQGGSGRRRHQAQPEDQQGGGQRQPPRGAGGSAHRARHASEVA